MVGCVYLDMTDTMKTIDLSDGAGFDLEVTRPNPVEFEGVVTLHSRTGYGEHMSLDLSPSEALDLAAALVAAAGQALKM